MKNLLGRAPLGRAIRYYAGQPAIQSRHTAAIPHATASSSGLRVFELFDLFEMFDVFELFDLFEQLKQFEQPEQIELTFSSYPCETGFPEFHRAWHRVSQ